MAEGGLLDFLSSPTGMGLLSAAAGGMAGARRGAPWNTAGAALLGGVSGYTSAQAAQIDQAKKKNELELMNQAIREMTGQGGNPAAGAQAPGSGGAGMSAPAQSATLYGAAPSAQSAPKSNGMSLRTLQLMGLAGMKNLDPLFNMYKYQNDGIERKPGTIYRNPTTGAEEYIPNVEKGYNFDPRTKAVTALPGFIDTNNAIKGGEAEATEKAKSRNTLLPLGYTRGGVPVGGSVGDYLGGQPAPINPQTAPQKGAKSTPANWSAINQKYAAGAGQRQSDQLTILQQERAKATNPNDIAMLDREIARFGGQRVAAPAQSPSAPAPTNTGQLDSDADKAAALAKVETEKAAATEQAKRLGELKFNAPKMVAKADSAITAIDEALKHKGLGTATGLQGMVDLRNYIPGTDAYDFRVRLDQLKGKTFMEAFESLKGGGQITEVEGQKATDAIARLSRAQSKKEFKSGLEDLKAVIEGSKSRLAAQISGQPVSANTRSADDVLKQYGVR